MRTDLDLWMAAAGLLGTLLDGGDDVLTLTAKTDATATRTSTAAVRGLVATHARTTRLRLSLEESRPVKLGENAC